MKVVIAGGRDIMDYDAVKQAIKDSGFTITEIVSGCATGVDTLGEQYASEHNLPVAKFPAYWATHGSLAGPLRNTRMAAYADAVIAVWDGKSPGTKDMIVKAKQYRLPLHIHMIDRANLNDAG